MKKVLLTHSYFLQFDAKQKKLGQPYAPLGTLYAAAFLRQQGFTVSVHDVMFARRAEDIIPAIVRQRPDYFVLYDDGFNYLTKMCLTNMRHAAFQMISLAKERGCTVVVSSSDSTDHFQEYLQAGADFVLLGEAEQTLLELLQHLESGKETTAVQGIAYKTASSFVQTPRRSVIKELDALPFPAWDLIDLAPYRQSWLKHAGYFSLNISTTRGCPFKCNWCAKPIYGNRYNVRSPQNVVAELLFLKQQYNFEHIWFCDDIFGLKPGWVQAFAELVQQNNLRLKFKIQSRADLLVQDTYVAALAKAGCDNVWMGAESGSQRILDAMDKGITIEQIATATALLKKHQIKPSFFIQFGYLGETQEDIDLTIQMIHHLLPHDIGISVSYPLPGTKFYEKVKAQLKEKANWTDSDDLAMMFQNHFQPPFYRQLHRYVHKSYRKELAQKQVLRFFRHPFRINKETVKSFLSALYYIPATFVARQRLKKMATSCTGKVPNDINELKTAEAFSKQSQVFDATYNGNAVIQYKRQRVREHVTSLLQEGASVLELNCGTGEDALFFAEQGYRIHATDVADGMLQRLKEKAAQSPFTHNITTESCSFHHLDALSNKGPFDAVFSNFGGLNCTGELDKVLRSLPPLVKPNGVVTLVVIPPFCLWETLLLFKGKWKTATRRFFSSGGRKANVEGVSFKCWYYRPSFVIRHLQEQFVVEKLEGLCTLVQPSYLEGFAEKYPELYRFLQKQEHRLKAKWPWRSTGDYFIISLRKKI